MPEILICNVDPAWGFAHLCQCHGLDLYLDEELAVWDVGTNGDIGNGPLPWPRPLPIEEVRYAVEELIRVPGECPKQVILICGFQSEPDWNRVSGVINFLPPQVKRFLICSEQRGPKADLPIHSTFLTLETDPHTQFLIFRLIQEILQKDPELLLGHLPHPSHGLEVNFSRVRDRIDDRVALDWPPVAAWLEKECQSFLSSRNLPFEREECDEQIRDYLAKTMALLKEEYSAKTPPEVWDTLPPGVKKDLESGSRVITTAEVTKASLPKAPLFYKKEIAGSINKKCEEFYEVLTAYLRALYRRCTEERDKKREEIRTSGEGIYQDLEKAVTSVALGYGQSGVYWLEQILHRVHTDLVPEVQTKLNERIKEMGDENSARENLQMNGRDGGKTHFTLMHFAEDDALDKARNRASVAAESLAGLRFFWIAAIGALGLGALPGLARWRGGGAALFSEVFDLPWIGLFGASLVISMLAVCLYRRSRLRKSLTDLETALTNAKNRHVKAYCAIFDYLSAREAMERLQRLAGYCHLHLDKINQETDTVRNLQTFLKEQLEYYRQAGFISAPLDPMATIQTLGPSTKSWLKDALKPLGEKWTHGMETEIEIQGLQASGPRIFFKSSYFQTAPHLLVKSPDEES